MTRSNLLILCALVAFVLGPITTLAQSTAQPPVTTEQAEATFPGVPPAPVAPTNVLGWQVTAGFVVNELMRRLKASKLVPWMTAGTANINAIVAVVLAAVSSLGIHTEFDRAAGTLLITGLTWVSIMHFGGDWLQQYVIQHLTYKAVKEAY